VNWAARWGGRKSGGWLALRWAAAAAAAAATALCSLRTGRKPQLLQVESKKILTNNIT